ncbi:MAG: DUF47 family protein [Clostridiales bacterium]|nr:DUF47 family protein [Clostridiales bacterium]
MARNKSEYYFDKFVDLVDYSYKAANLLNDTLNNFRVDKLEDSMKEMHAIEHQGDVARHAMIRKLAKEFITPIEREDIMALADSIDNVTDALEDVLMRIYMCNITSVRDDALKMSQVIVKCCNALKLALAEFHNFRKSQTLHELIVEINHMEEEGDKLYTEAIRNLYVNCKDCLEVMGWEQTFRYLEKCCDACEDVADIIESVMLKNS